MSTIDKRFALLDRLTGDELYPYMKSQKETGRFGFALTRPGEQDRRGGGDYTTDIKEVIRRVVIDGWSVRVQTTDRIGKQRNGTLGIGKTANADYWVSPEFLDLVRNAPVKPQKILRVKQLEVDSDLVVQTADPDPLIGMPAQQTPDSDIEFASRIEYPLEDIQQRAIKTRRGQPDFRRRLFAAYNNQCAVSGCTVNAVLEAAHIVPHAEGTDWNTCNGLPLRADIHTLFDLRLLAIDPDYRIHICRELAGSDYEELHKERIRLPQNELDYPSSEKLAKHFKGFQERNSGE